MNILSLLRALSHRYVRGASALGAGLLTPPSRGRGRTPSRQPSPYRPRVEALEDRRMLSSIQMLPLGDGTFQLRVNGDAKANQVSIVGQGPGDQTNNYSLVVTCDQLQQTVNHVSELLIDTRGGADTVLLTGQWEFQGKAQTMSGVRSISVNTADGDDSVKFIEFDGQSLNGVTPGPHIVIDTGNGDDLAWFRPIFHPPTLFAGLHLSVLTGGGDDDVLVENLAFAAPSADAPAAFGAVLATSPTDSLVAIDTAGGDDVVTLSNWTSGAGIIGPEVGLSDDGVSPSATIVASVVDTGNGDDSVSVTGTWTAVSDMLIGLGGGGDALSIAGAQFVDSFRLGVSTDDSFGYAHSGSQRRIIHTVFSAETHRDSDRLRSAGPDGDDTVMILGSTFAGSFNASVDLGSGDDKATFEDNVFGGGASLALIGGSGDDLALFSCCAAIGSFDALVDLGGGADTVTFMGSTFGGAAQLTVNGGAENDRIEIGGLDNDGDDDAGMMYENQFKGSLSLVVIGGSGDDLAFFSCCEIAGSFDASIDVGMGDDAATLMGNTFDGGAQLAVNGGAGHDRIEIGGEGYAGMMEGNQFGGSLSLAITGGSGGDLVFIDCNGMIGAFDALVDLGKGDDTLIMEENTFGGSLNLSAIGGVGGDAISFEYNSVSGAASVTLDLGQGDDEAILEQNYFFDALYLQIGGDAGNDAIACTMDWLSGLTDYDISLGTGDDTATFEGNVYDQGLTMYLDAGDGRDTVAFHGNSLAAAPSISEIDSFFAFVDLGKGDDTAMFAGNTVIGSRNMSIFGGDGKDLVTILCDGLGPVSVHVDLGDGRDTANVNLTLFNQDPAQQKPVTVRVLGGKGDDDLTLTVKADPEVLAAANLLIDGGAGFDRGMGGPFVKVNNCEK